MAVALLLGGLAGCNADSRYEVLSFFFDGVPDPNAPEQASRSRTATIRGGRAGSVTIYAHQPFAYGTCTDCHQSAIPTRSGDVPEGICQNCHEDFSKRYAIVHGPVAMNACDLCHTPHQSQYPGLLLRPAREICVQCHLPRDLNRSVPEHRDLVTSCTNCHDPHGGADRNFLRPQPVPVPPLQPPPDEGGET